MMPIIDRYIVSLFLKIFLICFVSFSGLFIVVDTFSNLEEFLRLGQSGNTVQVIASYYGPRVLQFFDRTAPLIALVAAIFSVALMQRTNELTAIAAGGISNRRIVRPILVVTAILVLMMIVNRELLIPQVRDKLAMNAQDLSGSGGRSVGLTVDHSTGILIRGQQVTPARHSIDAPEFTLPAALADHGDRITAEEGVFTPASDEHPAGYLLENVTLAHRQEDASSQRLEDRTIIFRPADNDWLHENQMFIASGIDTLELAYGRELLRHASLGEMIVRSRQPSSSYSNQNRVDIHWRIVQPIFDMSILLIGLPLVIARGERNLFLSAGICMLVVMLMVLAVIASQSLGAARLVAPPALAAWLPLIIFVPVAATMWRLLES